MVEHWMIAREYSLFTFKNPRIPLPSDRSELASHSFTPIAGTNQPHMHGIGDKPLTCGFMKRAYQDYTLPVKDRNHDLCYN